MIFIQPRGSTILKWVISFKNQENQFVFKTNFFLCEHDLWVEKSPFDSLFYHITNRYLTNGVAFKATTCV